MSKSIKLRVWGDYACFTRPEMKVERVSYDVMTPSAARNILQSILWKPAFDWNIRKIEVLNPIKWTSVRRNELDSKIPTGNVKKAMNNSSFDLGINIEDSRQQRAALLLRDVEYIIHADLSLTKRAGPEESEKKFYEMFNRRAAKGQCFWQPYFGCREFSAFFELLSEAEEYSCINETRALGWMLYDLDFQGTEPKPMFFNAQLTEGKLLVPALSSNEVRK